jgi:LuxR family maltose regulon positive regulatory protein
LTSSSAVARRHGREPQSFREGYVPRPALVARLRESRESKLVLIVAPAGYGKSTLVAEWAHSDERPFVWITADSAGELLPAHSDHPFVAVLDDAHTIPSQALKETVSALLARLQPGSQLALASRTEPPLAIGRLRANRALTEIRARDLAMTPAEAATLLRLVGLDLDFESVQALYRRTEGWPAGLYLAALSLLGQADVSAGLERFDGTDHLVAEYLRDEFLAPLSRKRARLLIRSSVLEDLSGPLCDAVLEQTATGGALAEMARSNLMLVPLDASHERFRWHGLFKAMLRSELRRTEPAVEAGLHGRASSWLERHGDLDGAIGHAVAAGDAQRAGELLSSNIVGYVGQGRNDTVQRWLSCFTPDQLAGCAPLALSAAHSWLATGNVDQGRHWRRAAGATIEASPDTTSLLAGIAVFDAIAAGWGIAQIEQVAVRACDLEPEHGQWRPYSMLLAGVAEHLAGNHDSAARRLEEGVALATVTAPAIAALCHAQLAMIAIDREDWDAAGEAADRATTLVEAPPLAASPLCALVFAASAAARAHEGRADEAKRALRHASDLLTELGEFVPWYGAETRILLARAALGLADTVRARTLLAEASRLSRRTTDAVIFQRWFEQAWAQIDTLAETSLAGPSSLTIAELRILRFLPSHRSFREIAERLDVSVNTVKTQAHAIYRKLDAASRSEAVARASRAGLLGS